MTSSSKIPRAVTIAPSATGTGASKWAPDELPSIRTAAPIAAANRITPTGMAASDEARMARASEDGYARGYEQGFRAGEFAEAARLRSAIAALEEGLISVERESARWVGNAEENICALAVTVARHILGRELATAPDQIIETVRIALAEFPVSESVRVRLNPQDMQVVSAAMATDEGRPVNRRSVRWNADARLAPGSCLIEGSERIVDGRVDVGLERMYRRLSNAGS
jgi:flagellar assembly protein FliH